MSVGKADVLLFPFEYRQDAKYLVCMSGCVRLAANYMNASLF